MSVESSQIPPAADPAGPMPEAEVLDYVAPSPPGNEPPKPNAKALAVRGSIWIIVGFGANQFLRLVSSMALTRLLVPEYFGLIALVQIFIMGLQMFSDVGIGPSIIQNKRGDDPTFLNTAWTIQVARGFLLWLACLALAWPAAYFYRSENKLAQELIWLLPVVGTTTIIAGFQSTSLFTLNRHMAIGRLTIFELFTQVVSIVVMVGWAYFHRSIWALVVGTIIAALLKTIYSFKLTPGARNHFAYDKQCSRELFRFGRWVFLNTSMTFVSGQVDRLILGKMVTLDVLGVYTIAYTISDIPRKLVQQLGGRVIMPTASRFAHGPRNELRKRLQRNRMKILIPGAVLTALLTCGGDYLVRFAYDSRYWEAAWMTPILSIGVWMVILCESEAGFLKAIGEPRYDGYGSIWRLILVGVGLPLAIHKWGIVGAVIVVAAGDIPNHAAVVYGLWKHQLLCIWQDILATAALVAMIALLLWLRHVAKLPSPFQLAR